MAAKTDQMIIMGDFSAKVGVGDDQSIMGTHGMGERNEREDSLLDFCFANNLCITNTKFKQSKPNRKWTRESPDNNTHNIIDYILVNKRMMGSVRNSRALPSADCGVSN